MCVMKLKFIILIVLLLAAAFSMGIGTYDVSFSDLFSLLFASGESDSGVELAASIVWQIRLPRILLAILVGAALATSGATYQSCFRNPLVEPYILGASSGAALGAAIGIVFQFMPFSVQLLAFVFAVIAVFTSYYFAMVDGKTAVVSLILSGVIVGAIFSALVSIVQYLADIAALREIVFWLMGGFYYATWTDVFLLAPFVIGGVLLLWAMGWKLNVLSLGEVESRSLGVDPGRYKVIFILMATVLTAVSVSVAGIIAWVGLMMPHAARMLAGPDNRQVIPVSALLGAIYMLICDDISRCLINSEIPVGIVTSILGAPFLLFLIRKNKQKAFM